MKVNFSLNTSGRGYWSDCKRTVKVYKIDIPYIASSNLDFGELRAYFRVHDWDTYKHGLIYTDIQWLIKFRAAMKKQFKLSDKAVKDITYSEQGMQGDNYVSMDVSDFFLKEFVTKTGFKYEFDEEKISFK